MDKQIHRNRLVWVVAIASVIISGSVAQAREVIIPLGRIPGSMLSDDRQDTGLPVFPPRHLPAHLSKCEKFVRGNQLYLRCEEPSRNAAKNVGAR